MSIIKIKQGPHEIRIREGHPRDVGKKEKILFPFPHNGYKYFGIYDKTKLEE